MTKKYIKLKVGSISNEFNIYEINTWKENKPMTNEEILKDILTKFAIEVKDLSKEGIYEDLNDLVDAYVEVARLRGII